MALERKIAKHLLDIEAVALRPNDYFTWTSGIKSPASNSDIFLVPAPSAL